MTNSTGRLFRRFLLAASMLFAVCQPAFAEKRVALVIGNAVYQNVPRLPNPANDGTTIATTLKNAGFDVVDSRHDLTAADTRRALRDFADRARDADIAVVYYAGHGIEVDGGNYLIPVDAKLERDTDVYDEALSLDRVLLAIEPAKKLRLVILDACRDNPFSKNMKRTVATRAIGQGLAKVEPTSPNMLIAYSAKAGSTAADGDGKNSPFTVALSKHLTTPGLDVRRAFGFVRDDVLKTTNNRQEPFVYGSLGGEDVPLVPAPAKVDAAGRRCQSAGRSPPRLRTRAADRQQERDERVPFAVPGWLLRQPCQAAARKDHDRGNPRCRHRKGAARRTGTCAARRRRRAEGDPGQGRSRREGRRAGPHRGRKGQADCAGSGCGRRTEAR